MVSFQTPGWLQDHEAVLSSIQNLFIVLNFYILNRKENCGLIIPKITFT